LTKTHYSWAGVVAVCGISAVGFALLSAGGAQAQSQYPILNDIANKVVAKYQNSTCEQLYVQKSAHAPPSMEEQRIIGVLHSDPQMRAAFINIVAPPIANKMFDCGMIP
jgi:hypothetical protein